MKFLVLATALMFVGISTTWAKDKSLVKAPIGVDMTTYGEVRAYVETSTEDDVDDGL